MLKIQSYAVQLISNATIQGKITSLKKVKIIRLCIFANIQFISNVSDF